MGKEPGKNRKENLKGIYCICIKYTVDLHSIFISLLVDCSLNNTGSITWRL